MNLKLLIIITNDEKKLTKFIDTFHLPFNYVSHGIGTATKGILDFLAIEDTEKIVSLSIIPEYLVKDLRKNLTKEMKLQKIGNGVAFIIPISSASKYVLDEFKEGEEKMNINHKSELIITIVNEGYAEKVMNVAKKYGANGGTLIKGRGFGGDNHFKLFNMTIEPEKDILLIVCDKEKKNEIMNNILEKNGIKTEGKAICFSVPVEDTLGIE